MTLQANVPQEPVPEPRARLSKPETSNGKTLQDSKQRIDECRQRNHTEKVSDLVNEFWKLVSWMTIAGRTTPKRISS